MSEMVERVALEINKLEACYEGCGHCKNIARAAIEAMREPTDSQRLEFYKMKLAEGHTKYSSAFQDADWNRAIDAALKE